MSTPHRVFGWTALVVTVLAAIAALSSSFGYHQGWWGLARGFDIIYFASWAAGLAVVLALLVVIAPPFRSPWAARAAGVAALIVGGATLVPAWVEEQIPYVRQLPLEASRLTDITSDVGNPPTMMDLAQQRGEQPTATMYGGATFAKLQLRYFPDIQPVRVPMDTDRAFQRARTVVEQLGWTIVAAVPDQGRIEAIAKTGWFNLEDDVVIRVSFTDRNTSKIDIRSASRVVDYRYGDKGTNARRVREFLRRVQA